MVKHPHQSNISVEGMLDQHIAGENTGTMYVCAIMVSFEGI